MQATARASLTTAFSTGFIARIATTLPAMISTKIRSCNHDKRQNDDGQEYDADEVHILHS